MGQKKIRKDIKFVIFLCIAEHNLCVPKKKDDNNPRPFKRIRLRKYGHVPSQVKISCRNEQISDSTKFI